MAAAAAASAQAARKAKVDAFYASHGYDLLPRPPHAYSPALHAYPSHTDDFIPPRVGTKGPRLDASSSSSADMDDSEQPAAPASTTNAAAAAPAATGAASSSSYLSADARTLDRPTGSYAFSFPVPPEDEAEITNFIRARLNSLKALLAKRDKTQTSLDSLAAHKRAGSIPKALQIADLTAQLPASQPELRAQIQKRRADLQQEMLDTFIESQTKELARVTADIQGFRTRATKDFHTHLGKGDSDTNKVLGIDPTNANYKIYSLQQRFQTSLDEHLLRASRTYAAQASVAKTKADEQKKAQEERKEAMADAPADINIQQLVDAAVAKRLSGASSSSSTKSRKKAATGKKKPSSPPKNGHSHKSKKPPKGSQKDKGKGSGSLGQPNKNSRGGASKPSNKSKRK